MPGVVESAVIGVPDPDFGEIGVAVIVAAAERALDEAHVLGELQRTIAAYKAPKRAVFVPRRPRRMAAEAARIPTNRGPNHNPGANTSGVL